MKVDLEAICKRYMQLSQEEFDAIDSSKLTEEGKNALEFEKQRRQTTEYKQEMELQQRKYKNEEQLKTLVLDYYRRKRRAGNLFAIFGCFSALIYSIISTSGYPTPAHVVFGFVGFGATAGFFWIIGYTLSRFWNKRPDKSHQH